MSRGPATGGNGHLAVGPPNGPTAVRVVDLDRPIADVALPAAHSGHGYESLLVVPRLHGLPLGTLYLDLWQPDWAPREELAAAIWNQAGDQIQAHFKADGILPPQGPEDFTPPTFPCADTPLRAGPMASVIITTCADVEATVRCLNAVLAMAYRPFEVIVVDNRPVGSVLRSAVSERFGADGRVRVVDEPRPGLAVARNAGLREAEGDIIGVIDDDVLVDRDWLARIAKRFEAEPGLSCVTGLILPAELETAEQAQIERFAVFGKGFSRRTFSIEDAPDGDRLFPYAAGQFGSGANTALRAEAVDLLGGYEERLGAGTPARGGEDLDLFIRWVLAGARIGYEPAALVWHRHPAAVGAPRRQAINYGIGLSAALTHHWLVGGERARLARAVPSGIAYLRDAKSRRNVSRGEGFSRSLTGWEAVGLAAGPLAYLVSRARFGRHARSRFTPRWVDEVELARPQMDRPVARQHDGRRYPRARLLVRSGGRPRGFLELDLSTGKLRAQRVEEAARGLVGSVPTAAGAPPKPAGRSQATDVSVVVCTRDRPASLWATLLSVLDASPAPLEVLVIDNAPSTAGAQDVVLSLDDPRVRYIREAVPGLSRARNRGLAEARGEIVAFTDDDVRVDQGWLGGLERGFALACDVALVTGLVAPAELETASQQIFESKAAWTADCTARVWDLASPPSDDVLFPYTGGRFGTGANFALKRELTQTVGPFDEALGAGTACGGGEDLDMFLRVLLDGFKLAYEPTALVWHQHRREPAALRAQMFGYAAGLSAYACKHLLRSETRAEVVRRLPMGVLRAGKLTRRGVGSSTMLRTQALGYVCGPVLYARSRRVVAQRGGPGAEK
jgi:GT2 family glycosyltransferase